MWKNILIVSMIFIFCACTKNENYNPPVFPEERKIEGVCLAKDLLISYAYGMCVDDSHIYVLALADKKWVQVYDRNTGLHLGGFVGQGKGPGEVSVGESITLSKDGKHISVYDQAQRRLVTYGVSGLEGMPLLSYEKDISFALIDGVVRNAWPLEKNLLVNGQLGSQDGNPKRFQLLENKRVVDEYNDYPVDTREQQLAFLSPQVCFSPSFEKMATGIFYGGILETFHLADGKISSAGIYKFYEPLVDWKSGAPKPEAGMRYGFSSMCATEDLIYTVLIGDEDPNKLNHISVFDWNGFGIAKYYTEQLVFKLAAIKDEIYALTFEPSEGFSLYKYKYPRI